MKSRIGMKAQMCTMQPYKANFIAATGIVNPYILKCKITHIS